MIFINGKLRKLSSNPPQNANFRILFQTPYLISEQSIIILTMVVQVCVTLVITSHTHSHPSPISSLLCRSITVLASSSIVIKHESDIQSSVVINDTPPKLSTKSSHVSACSYNVIKLESEIQSSVVI